MVSVLISAAWIFVGIQSPFLVACSYGLIRRFDRLASPWLVFPSVTAASLYFYQAAGASPEHTDYTHFLYASGFLLTAYLVLWWRLGYTKPQALVLAILTMMAIDELWQTPYNVFNWTRSLYGFEYGIATAGWNFMAFPFILVFLLIFNGRIATGKRERLLFALCLGLSALEVVRVFQGAFPLIIVPGELEPYYVVFPWFLFFLSLFHSSRIPTYTLKGPVPTAAASHTPRAPPPG